MPGRIPESAACWRIAVLFSIVAVVLLAFSAYLNPAMLIGLANLRLCS